MNAFDAELALDRLDARLAAELPAHLAAAARAYADGTPEPPAIAISTREIDAVVAARSWPETHARATRSLRVIAPMVIESAPPVIAALARERTWDSWRRLVEARDASARQRFGVGHRALVHALAGVTPDGGPLGERQVGAASTGGPLGERQVGAASTGGPLGDERVGAAFAGVIPPPIDGWRRADRAPLTDEDIRARWASLCGDEVVGALSILRSTATHSRTFVVEPGARATIVVPSRVDSHAAMFALLHELGHAALWLSPASRLHEWPRAIDEAAAAYVARSMESGHDAHACQLAIAARARRLAIAKILDAIEAGAIEPATVGIARPPWALWTDPHAQAAYIEAERIADELPAHSRTALAQLVERAQAIDAIGG